MTIALYVFGYVTFLPVERRLPIIQGMIGLDGFGNALVMVSSFGRAQSSALKLGYANDINTFIIISGRESLVE